jgi:hypothetical protein
MELQYLDVSLLYLLPSPHPLLPGGEDEIRPERHAFV